MIKILNQTIHRPIIVVGFPRTGTSMVSGILAGHGVWVGTCRKPDSYNPKGYFENVYFASLVCKDTKKFPYHALSILERDRYTDGPWMVKHNIRWWVDWKPFKPVWVVTSRSTDAILKSFNNMDRKDDIDLAMVKKANNISNRIISNHNGICIHPDRLISGDYKGLEQIFNAAGIDFDRKIADNFIHKGLWHFGK